MLKQLLPDFPAVCCVELSRLHYNTIDALVIRGAVRSGGMALLSDWNSGLPSLMIVPDDAVRAVKCHEIFHLMHHVLERGDPRFAAQGRTPDQAAFQSLRQEAAAYSVTGLRPSEHLGSAIYTAFHSHTDPHFARTALEQLATAERVAAPLGAPYLSCLAYAALRARTPREFFNRLTGAVTAVVDDLEHCTLRGDTRAKLLVETEVAYARDYHAALRHYHDARRMLQAEQCDTSYFDTRFEGFIRMAFSKLPESTVELLVSLRSDERFEAFAAQHPDSLRFHQDLEEFVLGLPPPDTTCGVESELWDEIIGSSPEVAERYHRAYEWELEQV